MYLVKTAESKKKETASAQVAVKARRHGTIDISNNTAKVGCDYFLVLWVDGQSERKQRKKVRTNGTRILILSLDYHINTAVPTLLSEAIDSVIKSGWL